MFTAYRYRLYPTAAQEVLIAKHFGCVRWVYNRGLEMKTTAWNERKENVSRFDIQKHIPAWKKDEATSWLTEVNSQSLQSALANLDAAYVRFFREKKGFPKFKSKHRRQSFQAPQKGCVGEGFISVPKLGKIKAVISCATDGSVKTVTISKTTTGKYFASVLCDDGKEPVKQKPVSENRTIGIDVGLKHFATLSTGEKIENPRYLKWSLRKLARTQRQLSRKKKGSNNRNRQRMRVARVHEKVANRRNDFLHKLTTKLVRDNQTDSFAIEDLAVQNMMQNNRLARSISDAGWGEFRRQLEYKAERVGKNVLVIGRFEPSSKMCSCGKLNHELKLSDRKWTCECGLTHDRDVLAAQNIKRIALHPQNFLGRDTPEFTLVETPVTGSLKQESRH